MAGVGRRRRPERRRLDRGTLGLPTPRPHRWPGPPRPSGGPGVVPAPPSPSERAPARARGGAGGQLRLGRGAGIFPERRREPADGGAPDRDHRPGLQPWRSLRGDAHPRLLTRPGEAGGAALHRSQLRPLHGDVAGDRPLARGALGEADDLPDQSWRPRREQDQGLGARPRQRPLAGRLGDLRGLPGQRHPERGRRPSRRHHGERGGGGFGAHKGARRESRENAGPATCASYASGAALPQLREGSPRRRCRWAARTSDQEGR